jgi:hypothetical protein
LFVVSSEMHNLVVLEEGKVVLLHAMKADKGRGVIAPLMLNLGNRWKWVISFTPRPLYSRGKTSATH